MTQYQIQDQIQEQRVKLQPLKLKRRKGKGLLWISGALMAIAATITFYKPQPQPKPVLHPQPQPSPTSGEMPTISSSVDSSPLPLVSVQPLEEPTLATPDINRLVKVTAAKSGKTVRRAQSTIQPQLTSPATSPQGASEAKRIGVPTGLVATSPANSPQSTREAKRIGITTGLAATSIAVPSAFVVSAAAVANPVRLTTIGDAGTGAIAGKLTKTAIAKVTLPLPNLIPKLSNGGGNPPNLPSSGGGSSGGEGLPPGSASLGGGKYRTPDGTVMQEVDCATGKPITR